MTRSEAVAPLKAGEGRFQLTAGMAVRGQVRTLCDQLMLDYHENKGWFDSSFIVRGPAARVVRAKTLLEQAFGEE